MHLLFLAAPSLFPGRLGCSCTWTRSPPREPMPSLCLGGEGELSRARKRQCRTLRSIAPQPLLGHRHRCANAPRGPASTEPASRTNRGARTEPQPRRLGRAVPPSRAHRCGRPDRPSRARCWARSDRGARAPSPGSAPRSSHGHRCRSRPALRPPAPPALRRHHRALLRAAQKGSAPLFPLPRRSCCAAAGRARPSLPAAPRAPCAAAAASPWPRASSNTCGTSRRTTRSCPTAGSWCGWTAATSTGAGRAGWALRGPRGCGLRAL